MARRCHRSHAPFAPSLSKCCPSWPSEKDNASTSSARTVSGKAQTLAALALLGGCNLAPPHVRPPLPTAPAYPTAYADAGAGSYRAPTLDWPRFFSDPLLIAYIDTALANNRDLRVATARIEEARGLYRVQNADRLPNLDGSASYTRTRVGAAGLGIGGGTTTGTGTGIGTGTGVGTAGSSAVEFDRYQIGVAVTSFELDFWGRVRNLAEAARAQYLGTIEAERAFRLSLIRDVATAYLTVVETNQRLDLAERTVTSRRDGVRIAKRRLDAGVTSALDYRQAETLLTQAETSLAALRVDRAQAGNLLAALVGAPLPEPRPQGLLLERQNLVRAIEPGLPSELLQNRPDVLAAEEDLRAARANIGAARAAFFPTISLTGNLGFASSSLSNLVGSDGLQWSFGPSLALPIFDGGRLRGNLTVARARESIALATYERTIQTAFQEVADALAGRKWLAEQVEAQARAVAAQRALATLARTRYQNGVANYLEVLDAERNLFDAEQSLIQVRRGEAANLVALYVALGGGLTVGTAP